MDEKRKSKRFSENSSADSHINNLDDGCLMHVFSFLSPIPDRYNTALVCHRWLYLACHPRLWLRVDRSIKDLSDPGVFPNIESAVSAARPGDTILIAAGGTHHASNIQIKKPLCLVENQVNFPSMDDWDSSCLHQVLSI
ncbi:SKP1/ASK-interacting protein 5 [Actinidia rufa]|uniref:SKP1/ASK-interacting protein 5 n=1 Tax=Actinidia rufa TaxID=165716 RepID=A0A7J0F9Q6_9ERIC|nr:SKP1/ASK-interacting protein 5 [Actinidia rufa]